MSFSKKRYITEVNQKLEERYLTEKINFVLNEQAKEFGYLSQTPEYKKYKEEQDINTVRREFKSKFPCVSNRPGAVFYKDGSYKFPADPNTSYYSNGRYATSQGSGSYTCERMYDNKNNFKGFAPVKKPIDRPASSNNKVDKNPQSISNQPSSNLPPKSKVTSQTDPNFKLDKTTRTLQGDAYQYKLINCVWHYRRGPKRNILNWKTLANNQKAIDYLNSKFPDDIKNCPKPTSPAYQAQDNLDPDQMGSTNVQNPQVSREVIQSPQSLPQRNNQQSIPNPQISLATQQAAGKQIQDKFNMLKKQNPNLTTDQINAILRQDIKK